MIGTDRYKLVNNDVVSQHIGDTVREISNWDVNEGAGDALVHQWALKMICSELEFCWNRIKELENRQSGRS